MQLLAFIEFLNSSYLHRFNTILQGGYEEPFYQPAQNGCPAEIQFTRDYFRSALHELAHWCIAGLERRKLPDYGYWYAPDGRDTEQQKAFYMCEVKPQALEKAFSEVCSVAFEVSVDNLNNPLEDGLAAFINNVEHQYAMYLIEGFPKRAEQIMQALLKWHWGEDDVYDFLARRCL